MGIRTATALVLAVGLSIAAAAGVGASSTPSAAGQALFTANWKLGVAG